MAGPFPTPLIGGWMGVLFTCLCGFPRVWGVGASRCPFEGQQVLCFPHVSAARAAVFFD